MRSIRQFLIILISALLPAAVLTGCASEKKSYTTTLMVYMCGSNLETAAGAATNDLQEMASAMPSDGSLEIVALAAGSLEWRSDVDTESDGIYRLTPEGLELVESGPSSSMGEPASLSRLLRYGYEHHKTDRYALLLWDHGAGPMAGVCFDERYTSDLGMDSLSLSDLRSALADSPFTEKKLAWIGFDSCLMASVETAWAVAPYAEYMIASQELEPVDGWCYSFLSKISGDPGGSDTGCRAVNAYADHYAGSLSDVTLSCIDLSKLDDVIREMDALFGSFSVDRNSYARFALSRSEARSIGSSAYSYDLVDLLDLLEMYEENGTADCAALRTALSAAVIHNRSNVPYRNGLSLYYPFKNKNRYTSPWSAQADELVFSENYRSFIRQAAAIWLGEPLVNWSQAGFVRADDANHSRLIQELTPEQAGQYAEARLLVLAEAEPGTYQFVYSSDLVDLRGSTLSCVYSGDALFVVDGDGAARSGSVYYYTDGDDLYTSAVLVVPDESSLLGVSLITARLRYRRSSDGEYDFVEAFEIRDDGAAGKTTLRLEDCESVLLVSRPRIPTSGDDGRLLPYSLWESSGLVYGDTFTTFLPKKLSFLPLDDGDSRFAMFEITDLQGEVWVSDMISLTDPNRMTLSLEPQTLLNCDACTITLNKAEISLGASPALELFCTAENHSENKVSFSMTDYRLDDTLVFVYSGNYSNYLSPGQSQEFRVLMSAELFRDAQIRSVTRLQLTASCTDCSDGFPQQELGTNSAEIPLRLNTQSLFSEIADRSPLDSTSWNGISIELADIRDDYSANPEALIHFSNPTETGVNIGWDLRGFRMNGCEVTGLFPIQKLELPAHCDTYLWLRFLPETGGPLPERSEQVHSIGMQVFTFDSDHFLTSSRREIADITLSTGR